MHPRALNPKLDGSPAFSVLANSLGDSYGRKAGELPVQGNLAPKHALTDTICDSSSRFPVVFAWERLGKLHQNLAAGGLYFHLVGSVLPSGFAGV